MDEAILNMSKELEQYLNTDNKKKIFSMYWLEPNKPSKIVQQIENVSLPSTERITRELKMMGALKKVEENSYIANWRLWLKSILMSRFALECNDEELDFFEKRISKKEMLTFYFVHSSISFGEKFKFMRVDEDETKSESMFILLKSFIGQDKSEYIPYILKLSMLLYMHGSRWNGLIKKAYGYFGEVYNKKLMELPYLAKVGSPMNENSFDIIKSCLSDIGKKISEMKKE